MSCFGLHFSARDLGSWSTDTSFQEARDTGFLLERLEQLWLNVPADKPLSVGVTLLDLLPAQHHQANLFEQRVGENSLSPVVDGLNRLFGRNTISFVRTVGEGEDIHWPPGVSACT